MAEAGSRLFAVRTSPMWCRLAAVAPFVVLGAIALAACGTDGDAETDAASDAGEAAEQTAPGTDDTAQDDTAEDGADGQPADAERDADTDDGGAAGADQADDGDLFPDVVGATAALDGDGTWTFSATLSSPYDSPERYADAWRVVGPDGTVFGVRELTHDHANEQPFTRSQSGIEIPESVTAVTVEGRDQVSGWGGATVQVDLER